MGASNRILCCRLPLLAICSKRPDPAARCCTHTCLAVTACRTAAALPQVLLNLFTAVVIENFEKQHEQEEWRLNPEHLEEFVNLWCV